MKFTKFLSSALALSLIATTATPAAFASEVDLDEQVFQSIPTEVYENPAVNFTDITEHWARDFIFTAVEKGLFSGKTAEIFDPEAEITRAEFTIVMLQLRNFQTQDAEGVWYTRFFNAGVETGIVPDSFTIENFDSPITREEMATMLIKTIGQGNFEEVDGNVQEIADYDDINEEYADYVTMAHMAGLMTGKDGNAFDPQGTAKRGEAATTAVNVAEKFLSDTEEDDDQAGDMLPDMEDEDTDLEEDTDSEDADTEEDTESEEDTDEDVDSDEEAELDEFTTNLLAVITENRSEDENTYFPLLTHANEEELIYFLPQYDITLDMVESLVISSSSNNVKAYGIAVMKPVEEHQEAVLAAVEKFRDVQLDTLKFYGGDEGDEIAECVKLEVLPDGTVIFVLPSEANTDLFDAIMEALTLG